MSRSLIEVLGGKDAQHRPFYVSEGRLDEPVRTALFGILGDRGPRDAYFLYRLGAMARGGSPLLYRAAVSDFARVQAAANVELGDQDETAPGPEFVWPVDRSWVVNTDYDLVSTYVACNDRLAEAILASDALEALPVSRETRIDNDADRINGRE
jgi:hypothetical protein